ncbi:MAG: hypothetical protein Q9227_009446 [Pyrenula ochraceoflavens]
MTDKLPPQLLALFSPRPPLRYIPPQDDDPGNHASKLSSISGVAAFLPALSEYAATDDYNPTESWLQRKDRMKLEKKDKLQKMMSEGFEGYKPDEDPQIRGDAFKTLFVARLSYDVKENDLEREFSRFGPIERIRIVKNENDKNSKKAHRGYAFIVYEREKDMRAAYKETDGIRIKDRRVLVDVERGRTVKGWKPRRFGGGLGGRGYTKAAPAGPGDFRNEMRPGFRPGPFNSRGGGPRAFRGDRGGFGGRGGIGYQGGGGFGGRGGHQGAPVNAPSGPGGRGGGFGGYGGGMPNGGPDSREDRRNGYGGDRGYGGSRHGDRDNRGTTGGNREPLSGRDRGYGDRDRDRDRDRGYGGRRDDDYSRKRYHDGDGYDDPRSKRRY